MSGHTIIADNAMLLAGRAVMGPSFLDTVDLMDRMRRQRHRITYESVGVVTPTQIREAVGTAEEFIAKVEALLEAPGE